MTQPQKTIGFECYKTMVEVVEIDPHYTCRSGPSCPHDKYRQAAVFLSKEDPETSRKLLQVMTGSTTLSCGMHDAVKRRQNQAYQTDYETYSKSIHKKE